MRFTQCRLPYNDFQVMRCRLERDCAIIIGVYTSIEGRSSAMNAFMRDIRAFAVADAMADFSPQDHYGDW
jgi:isochorismate hydrolase